MSANKKPDDSAVIGPYGIKDPSTRTLDKYGIDLPYWRAQIEKQKGLCPICQGTRERMVVDHEHARGWKKLPSEKRRLYVRGIVCWFCNLYYLCRGMNAQKAANIVQYMREFQERFDLGSNPKVAAARADYLINYEAQRATAIVHAKAVTDASAIRSE